LPDPGLKNKMVPWSLRQWLRSRPGVSTWLRTAAISTFVPLHFIFIILWILPPYSQLLEADKQTTGAARRIGAAIGTFLINERLRPLHKAVRAYVDLVGAHQYWDFFAPDVPRTHHYLRVCSGIRETSRPKRIDCTETLYQSYHGELDQVIGPHRGRDSRPFRLIESLIRLHRPKLLDAFTSHWQSGENGNHRGRLFLLLHEFGLAPVGKKESNDTSRQDEVLWITPD
jgi:hypothetical protein